MDKVEPWSGPPTPSFVEIAIDITIGGRHWKEKVEVAANDGTLVLQHFQLFLEQPDKQKGDPVND